MLITSGSSSSERRLNGSRTRRNIFSGGGWLVARLTISINIIVVMGDDNGRGPASCRWRPSKRSWCTHSPHLLLTTDNRTMTPIDCPQRLKLSGKETLKKEKESSRASGKYHEDDEGQAQRRQPSSTQWNRRNNRNMLPSKLVAWKPARDEIDQYGKRIQWTDKFKRTNSVGKRRSYTSTSPILPTPIVAIAPTNKMTYSICPWLWTAAY